jgi:OOP family OmpA-OmpF porin
MRPRVAVPTVSTPGVSPRPRARAPERPLPGRAGPAALLASTAALAIVATAPPARATDCGGAVSGPNAPLASTCINSDTLWPHAGLARFVAVGSTETVPQGQIGFGLVTSYLSRPILLHVPTPGPPGSDQNAVDDQVNGTFLWAYGVTDRLELDLALPLTFIQSGAGISPITGGDGLKDTAVRDLRFGAAFAILPHTRVAPDARPEAFGLAARIEVSAPTGDTDQFASDGAGVIVPSVAGDWRSGRFFAGAEVGARLRPTRELQGARVGTQMVTSLGVGLDILPREWLTATLEAWALPTFAEQHTVELVAGGVASVPNGSTIWPAEWQLAARTAPLQGGDFSIQLGGGGPIPLTNDAITMPRFRFTLGLRWAPAGRPRPAPPPALSPDATAPTTPSVDLHLAGARDVCTSNPDLVDGFKDNDGCPDEDQDNDGVPDRFDKCPMVPEDFVGLTDGCPEKK